MGIHRKLGNFAPKEREYGEPRRDRNEMERTAIEAVEQFDPLENCKLEELDTLEVDADEDILAQYRRERLAELKKAKSAARFGEVLHVTRGNFVHEVTEGSAGGQWVLVLLYVDSSSACHSIMGPWAEVARRHPAVKFMKGVAAEVVAEFPDSSTPAVLVYRNEDCMKQIVGLNEWGGKLCSADCVEWTLSRLGVVQTELEDDPREQAGGRSDWRTRPTRQRDDSCSDEEDDEKQDRSYSSLKLGRRVGRGGY